MCWGHKRRKERSAEDNRPREWNARTADHPSEKDEIERISVVVVFCSLDTLASCSALHTDLFSRSLSG